MVKLYTLCSVFIHRDLKVGPDIESKFHQGVMEIVSYDNGAQ